MRVQIICWLITVFSAPVISDDLGSLVNTVEFFQGRQGRYEIQWVAGEKPKEGNSLGRVDVNADMGMLELAYCTENFCDPGYLDFPFSQTQVFLKQSDGVSLYTLLLKDGPTVSKFELEESSPIKFRNFQYAFPQGEGMLEHVISKVH